MATTKRKVWVSVAVGDEAPLKHKVEIDEATYDISDFRDAIKTAFTPKLDFMPAAALKVKLGSEELKPEMMLNAIKELAAKTFDVTVPENKSNRMCKSIFYFSFSLLFFMLFLLPPYCILKESTPPFVLLYHPPYTPLLLDILTCLHMRFFFYIHKCLVQCHAMCS